MASPTLTLLNAGGLTDGVLSDADANTGWSNLTTTDTDIKVEGTGSQSGVTRNDGEDSYYDAGGAPVTGVGKILRGWVNTTNLPYMGSEASNPYTLWVFDGSSQSNGLALFGSDTYPGGWFYFWQSMDDFTGVTLANIDQWGIEAGHDSNAKNLTNMWMDVLRYLDGYSMTGGTSGDKITIMSVAASDLTGAYGIVNQAFGVYFGTGTVQIGSGATTTWFGMDGEVLVFRDTVGALSIAAGLYELNGQGSGCDIDIRNSVLRANGTTDATRFVVDFSDADVTLAFVDNLITRAGTVDFASGQTVTGNTFDDCGQIDSGGADMSGCVVKGYEGTADTAALVWDEATDPSGELDDIEFVKGTAATHALELGVNSPLSVTLNGHQYSGYNASNGQNDSTILVSRTSGTVTINVAAGGDTPSYKSAGATVVVVSSKTATFTPIENGSAFTITRDSDNFLLHDVTSTTGGEVVYSYDGILDGTAATVHLIISGKEPIDFPWTVAEGTVPIAQVTDRVYSNP